MTRKKNNYVNNKKFTEAMGNYKRAFDDDPKMSLNKFEEGNYIGHCILEICRNLANKANFINYTFKEEMVADAIENCIRFAGNFNPDKSKNAFGYFTQIAFNAFIRRIQKESKIREKQLMVMSDSEALNGIINKQFDGSEEGMDAQAFVQQIQNLLLENDQLFDSVGPKEKTARKKADVVSPLSDFI